MNASGGCEAAVTARVVWMKCREYSELLRGRRFPLQKKRKIYKSCVRPAMLYGSETWCLRENGMAILRRSEKSMMRAMCGVKLMDRENIKGLIGMFGFQDKVDKLAKAHAVQWYGHVLRRAESVLDF